MNDVFSVGLERMYALSFTTYPSVGLIVAVVVCVVVSAITGEYGSQ